MGITSSGDYNVEGKMINFSSRKAFGKVGNIAKTYKSENKYTSAGGNICFSK